MWLLALLGCPSPGPSTDDDSTGDDDSTDEPPTPDPAEQGPRFLKVVFGFDVKGDVTSVHGYADVAARPEEQPELVHLEVFRNPDPPVDATPYLDLTPWIGQGFDITDQYLAGHPELIGGEEIVLTYEAFQYPPDQPPPQALWGRSFFETDGGTVESEVVAF